MIVVEPLGEVYKITNLVTGAIYIGITRLTAAVRFRHHWKASKYEDSVLYRAMRKYGCEAFRFETVAVCEVDKLPALERKFIAFHRSHVRDGGYNMTGGGEGSPDICDLTRERMRVAASKRWENPQTRKKIIAANRGRKQTAETIAKRVACQLGRPLSDAHKKKLSDRHKGKIISPAQREKIAAKLRGRKLSPEHIEAVRQTKIGITHSEERKRNLRQALARPETKARKSAASLRMWAQRRHQSQCHQLQLL